ncbi:HTH-type transcriptional regulator CueR [Pseudoalteromonas holothuriae]|uniref:HTH-type transcriptional regulator CueR n=1 Tax=Pseudoalteromonas holothuriae TaxID=2963714 RepID=A0A9W4W352_9GAMM|nr:MULTISPECIES: helix-turn-helix domain-containing protein [unclassified Pseudoalteromonas]CAH9053803.1 HTH-type transcriptional regulator CueR [Pseudoalteromonas sp. CIP111951]CAH9055809.1 HTH-type transcriptional regulator CueR [Pseudoalteromonas sp. CIP111854]
MSDKLEITIRQVAKQTGLPSSTIRYYEELGLIRSIGRKGITRVFHTKVIEQLALVALARYAGFTLDEIAHMFSSSGEVTIDRSQLIEKADLLDKKIKQFEAMRDGLKHVAKCPEQNQLDCPKFQSLVSKAARTQLLANRKSKFA